MLHFEFNPAIFRRITDTAGAVVEERPMLPDDYRWAVALNESAKRAVESLYSGPVLERIGTHGPAVARDDDGTFVMNVEVKAPELMCVELLEEFASWLKQSARPMVLGVSVAGDESGLGGCDLLITPEKMSVVTRFREEYDDLIAKLS
jgi:hypothetical protein